MDERPSSRNLRAALRTAVSSSGIRISPSKLTRSGISSISRGRTGRSGLIHELGLTKRGVPWRPISRTYLKPSVTNTPTRDPLFSKMALVAMVVPWKICLT